MYTHIYIYMYIYIYVFIIPWALQLFAACRMALSTVAGEIRRRQFNFDVCIKMNSQALPLSSHPTKILTLARPWTNGHGVLKLTCLLYTLYS